MTQIDYYFSTFSSFTYLASDGLEKVAAKHGAQITYKPIDLLSLFGRTGGQPPKQRHESRQAYRLQEMRRISKKMGLEMNMQPAFFPPNAAPSSYAIIAAQAQGGGDVGALVRAFLRAVWVEDRDIAQDEVIRDCLTQAGFDPSLADSGLLLGAETYASNLEDAAKAGVFGSPFYIVDEGERFWGQDRLGDLDLFLAGKL